MKRIYYFLVSVLIALISTGGAKAETGDVITSLDQLVNNKCYTIKCKRGKMVVNNSKTAICSSHSGDGDNVVGAASTEEADGKWALLTINGSGRYLYNLGTKMFVNISSKLVNNAAEAVAVDVMEASNPVGDYKFKIKQGSNTLNNNNSGGIALDGWSTEDNGNRLMITEAGDFDATPFQTTITVTYNYMLNGTKVYSDQKSTFATMDFPTPTKPDYVECSAPSGTVQTSDNGKTYDIECTTSLPFKFYREGTAWESILYWNFLKLHGKYASYDPDNYPNFCPISSTNEEAKKENNAFAFIGDPYNGFRIVNRYAGESYTLSNTNNPWDGKEGGSTYAFMKERNSLTLGSAQGNDVEKFFVSKVNATTFYLQIKTYDGAPKAFVEMNDRNVGTNHFLSYWTGGNGDGSYVTTEETSFDLELTDVSEISNTKCYTISTTRGKLVINTAGTAAVSSHKINGTVVNNDASTDEAYGQWALLTFNGQSYYLFNVGLKKFLCADNTLSNDYKTAITIEAHGSQSGNYRFKLIGNSNWLNNNNSGGVNFDSHKGEDDGNRVQIAKAGDFDPTYFDTKYTFTYNYKINGETVFSESHSRYLGQTFPTPTKPSYVENSTPAGTVTESCNGQTYDIECTTSLPFKFYPEGTAWGSILYWNFLKLNGKYASYDPVNYPNFCPISNTNDEAKKENNAFAFIGDPYNGFRIVNRYAGENYTLSNTNNPWDGNSGGSTYAFMKQRSSLTLGSARDNDVEKFFVSKVNATTFYLQIKTYDGAPKTFVEMNDRDDGTNHFLSYWTGGNGSGSYVTIEETAFDLVQTTITWNILDDSDNIIATETLENCVQGNQYTTKYAKNIGATIANPTVTAGLEDQIINTHYTLDGSVIKISPNKENVTWYKMKIVKGFYPIYNISKKAIIDESAEPAEATTRRWFAFVGTPFGFKLYNKYVGLDTPLGTNISDGALTQTTDAAAANFVAEYSPNDGFTDKVMIRNVKFETAYLNNLGGYAGGTLGFWNSGNNRSDEGSFFEFTEVPSSELDQLVVLNYNYKNDENLWYTQKIETTMGASLPSTMTMPYGVTASSTPSGTVTAGTTDYDIPVTYNQGKSGMKFFNNIDEVDTWYNWSKRNAYGNETTAYVCYEKDSTNYDFSDTAELDNAYLWAAIGNPFQFKIVNRMTGFDYYLDNPNVSIGDGNTPTMKQTAGQDYFLYDCAGGAWGDYCFQVLNTVTKTALNGNGTLNYWVNDNTLGNAGSQMRWTPVDMAEVRKKAVVKEVDDLIQGQVYTITSGGTRGAFVYTENGLSSTSKLSIGADESSTNQQFLFVEKGGTHYLYSIGAGKFINITGRDENNNRAIAINGRPVNTTLQLLKSTNSGSRITNPTVLSIDGHYVGVSNGFTPAVITHYNYLTDEGNALRIKPVYGVTVDDMTPIMTLFTDWTGLENAIADAENPEVNMIGTGFGKYTADETFYTSLENAKNIFAAHTADETTVENAIASIALSNLNLNMPANGTLLHIKDADNNYMTCNNTSGNRIAFDATKDANTIFCYTGSALVAYTTGFYASRSSNFPYHLTGVTTESDGTLYHIHASPLTRGKYVISFGGDTRFMYKGADAGDFNGGPTTVNNTNYEFTLEETESIPVSISAAGLATLYSPMALTIPEGVKAYVGDYNSENSTVVLNALEGMIPANTGVIIEGAEGSYDFNTTTTATTATSCLTGSVPAIATPATGVYTLQKVNTKLGLYKYTGANLGAFKAYFQTSGGSNGFSLIVNDDDLTGVDSLTPNTSADNIYRDLQGNIVLYPQKNQIYILNGKKVLKQ